MQSVEWSLGLQFATVGSAPEGFRTTGTRLALSNNRSEGLSHVLGRIIKTKIRRPPRLEPIPSFREGISLGIPPMWEFYKLLFRLHVLFSIFVARLLKIMFWADHNSTFYFFSGRAFNFRFQFCSTLQKAFAP